MKLITLLILLVVVLIAPASSTLLTINDKYVESSTHYLYLVLNTTNGLYYVQFDREDQKTCLDYAYQFEPGGTYPAYLKPGTNQILSIEYRLISPTMH